MRLTLIHIGQETNDFNPVPTVLADYHAFGVYEGVEISRRLPGIGQTGGFFEAVARSGRAIETVPIIRAWAVAGGRIDRAAFDFFQQKIADGLREAGPIDGLALQLHGACAADGIDDVEGEQIALARSVLGPKIPIVLQLDHHANVTRKMARNATAIVAHRTQPHDPFDTGLIGTELLIRIAAGEVSPCVAFRKLPLLSHQEQFLTKQAPMKTWFDHARAAEAADPRVLHIAPFPMQPWLDVAEGGWAVTVTTDSDQALAERLADESAELAWSLRDAFQQREAVPIDAAVRRAETSARGVVVLSDTGDTVFGGSAGDSNLILESMLRLGIAAPALVPLIEPSVVARLDAAGEGATVTLHVGGSASKFFAPIEVTGIVRKLADGRIRVSDSHQPEIDMGRTAIFQIGPVTVLASEGRGLAGNHPDVYRAFGIEPAEYRMAVLKTASNFQYFAPITTELIRVDTKGPGQSDLFTLPWQRLPRPIFPLDPVPHWHAAQELVAP